MREARIILPINGKPGNEAARKSTLARLVSAFGGATVTQGRGIWADNSGNLHDEPGEVVDVACEDNAISRATLTALARTFGQMAHELAVYLRLPSGEVLILDTAAADQVAA